MMAVKAHIVPAAANGASSFADTALHTGKWYKLTNPTTNPAVIASSTSNIAGLSGFTIPAGGSMEGIFTAFTLTSGQVVAYKTP